MLTLLKFCAIKTVVPGLNTIASKFNIFFICAEI